MNRDSRFSRTELAELLQSAAELQAKGEGALEDSFTVAEAESVAAEAGIGADYMRAAARDLRADVPARGRALLGPPTVWVSEQAFPGRLSAAEAHRIIAEAQAAVPIAGGSIHESEPGVWRLSHEDRALVQVVAGEDEFRVALVNDRRLLRLGLLGGGGAGGAFAGVQITGGLILALTPEVVGWFALGMSVGGLSGGLAGLLGGAACWRLAASRWRERTEGAFARIRDAVAGFRESPESLPSKQSANIPVPSDE